MDDIEDGQQVIIEAAGHYGYTPGMTVADAIEYMRSRSGDCILCGKQTRGFGVWDHDESTRVTVYRFCGCGTAEEVEEAYWRLRPLVD